MVFPIEQIIVPIKKCTGVPLFFAQRSISQSTYFRTAISYIYLFNLLLILRLQREKMILN